MLKAIYMAVCLAIASGFVAPAFAQDTFVIVPDTPGGGGGSGGGGGGRGNAVATTNLNVRSGPGTRYHVVAVLKRGEAVRIDSCSAGWCWVNHRGPSGWASQNHLERTSGGGGGGGVRPTREACFYDDIRFRGRSFCAVPGESDTNLGAWSNRIASIRIRGFTTVQVCADRNFRDCEAFNTDVAVLPWWLERSVLSFRVFH